MSEETHAAPSPTTATEQPLVSVVIEGYNELQLATSVTEVLDGLAKQDYPLDRIELIMVGSEAQYRDWIQLTAETAPFARVETVEAEGALYYKLKNKGAERARGDVIAFIDSDVYPHPSWVSSIVRAMQAGADVTAGVSVFRDRTRRRTPPVLLETAASISFGHVVGEEQDGNGTAAWGIVAHNLALRADVFRAHPFETELGRNAGIGLLHETLRRSGAQIRLVPGQRVEHSFSPGWFLYPFHMRVGWEEYVLRRRRPSDPNRWLMRAGPLEPLVGLPWYVALDARQWFRYSRQLGLGAAGRWGRLPLLLPVSLAARMAGVVGMYGAMLSPDRSRDWAEAQ